jgi:hypothetical protein
MKDRCTPQHVSKLVGRWGRMIGHRQVVSLSVALLVGFLFFAAAPAEAAPVALPPGVPNIYDPEAQTHFQPVRVTNLRDNPEFPVVLLVNTTGQQPEALLVGLDARNGKDTWSLTGDPIILIVALSDYKTIQGLFVDTGFADRGTASGTYAAVDEANASALPDLLKAIPEAPLRTYM